MKKTTLKFNIKDISIVFILLFFMVCNMPLYAQNVGINHNGSTPKSSTILDLSTGNNTTVNSGQLGFLAPKVKLQATNVAAPITNPSNGLLVYDTVSAGTSPHNVTEGFYYWSGSVATGNWVRLEDNQAPSVPYGYNTQYVAGTTDDSLGTSTLTAMTQMSIKFTPLHSVVFLNFSASGIIKTYGSSKSGLSFEAYVNGAAATTTYVNKGGYGVTVFSGGGQTAGSDQLGAWNVSIYIPIKVTPGTSVTIAIYWAVPTGTSYADNNVNSDPAQCHRTMVITD